MTDSLPTGKWRRAVTGGHTAVKVGGNMLVYYAKRPFLSDNNKNRAREQMSRQSARTLFKGLSLLKGTALKMAQQLSLEMDMLPEAACHELAKAYHQVPPINRALVRKVVQEGLGGLPEAFFSTFDLNAYATASLGQVHRARDHHHRSLAVKIQYPGIAKTIDNDVYLLRHMLKPVIQSEHLTPALNEVAARLHEEVDYQQEADNLSYFSTSMKTQGVRIPDVITELTAPTVLTTTFMAGRPLDLWLQANPHRKKRDLVAKRLQSTFIQGLYELNAIHADPNPGNFIIADDLTINLVDFGCIKRLESGFVNQYRLLTKSAAHLEYSNHFQHMMDMEFFSPNLAPPILEQMKDISNAFVRWFSRLFVREVFDFGKNLDFISDGKKIMASMQRLRRHLKVNSDFIFLDRTRYGLLRLYEQMGARVAFRNKYEW
jgi:predicted unusual protein kinase regulating ubiquinone biosynthesis (AarF/ABC1/UbiB family)